MARKGNRRKKKKNDFVPAPARLDKLLLKKTERMKELVKKRKGHLSYEEQRELCDIANQAVKQMVYVNNLRGKIISSGNLIKKHGDLRKKAMQVLTSANFMGSPENVIYETLKALGYDRAGNDKTFEEKEEGK